MFWIVANTKKVVKCPILRQCFQNLDFGEGAADKKKIDPFSEGDEESKNTDIDCENNDHAAETTAGKPDTSDLRDAGGACNEMSESNCDSKLGCGSAELDSVKKETGAEPLESEKAWQKNLEMWPRIVQNK